MNDTNSIIELANKIGCFDAYFFKQYIHHHYELKPGTIKYRSINTLNFWHNELHKER